MRSSCVGPEDVSLCMGLSDVTPQEGLSELLERMERLGHQTLSTKLALKILGANTPAQVDRYMEQMPG